MLRMCGRRGRVEHVVETIRFSHQTIDALVGSFHPAAGGVFQTCGLRPLAYDFHTSQVWRLRTLARRSQPMLPLPRMRHAASRVRSSFLSAQAAERRVLKLPALPLTSGSRPRASPKPVALFVSPFHLERLESSQEAVPQRKAGGFCTFYREAYFSLIFPPPGRRFGSELHNKGVASPLRFLTRRSGPP